VGVEATEEVGVEATEEVGVEATEEVGDRLFKSFNVRELISLSAYSFREESERSCRR
jgi:hypothetical protein